MYAEKAYSCNLILFDYFYFSSRVITGHVATYLYYKYSVYCE